MVGIPGRYISAPGLAQPVAAVLIRHQARVNPLQSIRSALCEAVPGLRAVPISHQWCCFRPTHPDGVPVIDRVPGLANAWVTSGHFRGGILMAPATAHAIVEWIASGRQPPEVAGLEIGRFAAA